MLLKCKKVLLLGSGALKIGEAGEFDYSGSQAIKALKEEGIETILVNPNIATIQTSEGMADKVYLLPVTPYFVEQVIKKEKPDGIFLSFGGQTALNCGLQLYESGVLEKHGVKVLGTSVPTISLTEDRKKFADFLGGLSIDVPMHQIASDLETALSIGRAAKFPLLIRSAFALGGLGAGVARDFQEFQDLASTALELSPQIQIDEYLGGWKEIEYEVVRDQYDNCVTVCNMENFDPLGIHTGESIVVAPSQTLNDSEYQLLRNLSIEIVRNLKIVGECNVQFALHPGSEEYRVIEVNARLSRSSALASKATGYPLAFIAAKIGLGYALPDLKNSVTKVTTACFEPALDYITVKIPKWDLGKFRQVSKRIGPGMKSVGEVMAIGRNFEETIQKAIRMVDSAYSGLTQNSSIKVPEEEIESLEPTDRRLFAVIRSLIAGNHVDDIHEKTKIDRWFLYKLDNIVQMERVLLNQKRDELNHRTIHKAKKFGYSDEQLAKLLGREVQEIRSFRRDHNISPKVKQIDTLAAEYPAQTNYLYCSYHASEHDIQPANPKQSILILGSGAYKIGSSVEFDWCCVNTIQAFRNLGYTTILINNNPETVSTDYDECDRLYFDEITLERVLDVIQFEEPLGVVVSMGGQTPNNLALKLANCGVPILGTPAHRIDNAEDRKKFSAMLDELKIDQPRWTEVSSRQAASEFASNVGYPVIVRPSYVLSGAAMGIAATKDELSQLLNNAADISTDYPVVISKFVSEAQEVEVDGVGNGASIVCYAISEHVENAGVHSGDATLVCPPFKTPKATLDILLDISRNIVQALEIKGPFNIQFLVRGKEVKVIECNLRASRSFPFVSKILGLNFVEVASNVIMDQPLPYIEDFLEKDLDYGGVKAPHFSFTRLTGADPLPGIEMSSTGEVGCLGRTFHEAFLKSLLAVGFKLDIKKVLISAGPLRTKKSFLEICNHFIGLGTEIFATTGTYQYMQQHDINCNKLSWPQENSMQNALTAIEDRNSFDLVINIPKNNQSNELTNAYQIRRKAVDIGVPLITNLELALEFSRALAGLKSNPMEIQDMESYYKPAS